MNRKLAGGKIGLLIIFSVFRICHSFAQLVITSPADAPSFSGQLAGPGVVITNPVITCPLVAYGIFTATASNLGIDKGILLTTGRAKTEFQFYGAGGASSLLASNNNGSAGDATLNSLAGRPTSDACALEFDLTAASDYVSFQYVFGSEEYINATCGPYNDAFAYFISGPGINGTQNMALVPGTAIPVTINSINSGVPGGNYSLTNCTSMGVGSPFTSYYTDNSNGTTITYKGFTTVLTAGHTVLPCSTYHLKMIIADAGNALYDSGVFIKAGSLRASDLSVTPMLQNSSKPYIVKGCLPGSFKIKRTAPKTTAQTVHYTISGTAVNGYDYAAIADSVVIPANDTVANLAIQGLVTPKNGSKTVTITLKAQNNCTGGFLPGDSATITIRDTVHAGILTRDTAICLGSSITLSALQDSVFTYQWSPAQAFNDPTIANPSIAPSSTATYSLSVSIPGTGCAVKNFSVNVKVNQLPVASFTAPENVCLNDSIRLQNNTIPSYKGYLYQWTGPDSFASALPSPLILHAGEKASGIYTLVVKTDTSNCTASASQNITILAPGEPNIASPLILCLGSGAQVKIKTTQDLSWYSLPTSGAASPNPPLVNTDNIATHHYYVTSTLNGCESNRKPIDIQVLKCCDGTILIPNAFSPNGDGNNDVFRPLPDYGYKLDYFRVYNRWGQCIFYSGYLDTPWDGTEGGKPAAQNTYYYEMQFGCINGGKEFRKGSVILLR